MCSNMKDFFNLQDKFCLYNGIKVIEVEKGYAKTQMNITENHFNGVGVVQGGAIFTLADLALAASSNSYGNVALGTSMNINYFRPGKGKFLYAVSKEINRGKTTAAYNIDVFNEDQKLIANAIGTVFIKKDTIDFNII